MKLVIVESPTKAKTISRFLGKDYKVLASYGHIRDLPKSKLGVDVEHNFEPTYTVSADHKAKVKEIKTAADKAKEVLLATDEDREGEAIAWHLAHVLGADVEKIDRITFHEITDHAIKEALAHPRKLDMRLINAQQARRILDRLVGYELSPLLWKKIRRGLSAGRVQSVALRLVVEREQEIQAFNPVEYWSVEGVFAARDGQPETQTFEGKLHALDGKTLDKMAIKTEEEAKTIVSKLEGQPFRVSKIDAKERKASPPPPFTTSTLQQEANKRLSFSAKQTMTLAQRLYEGIDLGESGPTGLITYMRTDSVNLSDKFLGEAAEHVKSSYGAEYTLKEPRKYKTKSKGAQEAHEAIRPTDPTRVPESIENKLEANEFKLYKLIWQRAVATQMSDARIQNTSADLACGNAIFRSTGQTVVFDGYLKLFPDQDKDKFLPDLKTGDEIDAKSVEAKQHFTEPPARFSDATLVKALEEMGIGRPSTYAPTISSWIERDYVERDDKKRFLPTPIGTEVTSMLKQNFPDIVDFDFTSRMENSLDKIAEGEMEWQPLLQAFYGPFETNLKNKEKEMEAEEQKMAEGLKCEKCGSPMVVKRGRFGKFFACSNYPECKFTMPMPGEKKREEPEPTDEKCPTCGAPMVKRVGSYGPFLSCSRYPECKTIKNIDRFVLDQSGNQIACPKCKQGFITERLSKKKKVFYSCNRYPDCDQAFWDRPTGEACPKCGYPTLLRKGATKIYCPNEGCGYKETQEKD